MHESCVLKVNIHCDGCEQKVKKLLQKIEGVYSVRVDADEGKVVVAGDVDPAKLVKKLKRAGKHAEIWGGGQKGMMFNQNYPINSPFQNMLVDNGKGAKDNKSQNHKGQKGSVVVGGGHQGQVGQLEHFQNVKGVQDFKVPTKEHKSVKFNLPEEDFGANDDDGFDEHEDNFDDYDEEEEKGVGHSTMHQNKMMPMMGDGRGPHGPAISNNSLKDNAYGSRNNNGSVEKGDVIDPTMLFKGKGGNYIATKSDNSGGKKSGQKGENKNEDKPKHKGGGFGDYDNKKKNGKSDGGLLGRFLGFGKKSKKVEFEQVTYGNRSKNQNNKGKEGKLKGHEGKKDIDFDDFGDYDDTPFHHKNSKRGKDEQTVPSPKAGNYPMDSKGGKEDHMGPSPKMDDYPMSHEMENIPAMQGVPSMKSGGGGYQGMQMQHAPYNNLQQQQYMTMMMNQPQQQQANVNNNNNMMYPPAMMYGMPHPSMNYMPPPPMPSHPMADPITHTFSDENVESCSIM